MGVCAWRFNEEGKRAPATFDPRLLALSRDWARAADQRSPVMAVGHCRRVGSQCRVSGRVRGALLALDRPARRLGTKVEIDGSYQLRIQ